MIRGGSVNIGIRPTTDGARCSQATLPRYEQTVADHPWPPTSRALLGQPIRPAAAIPVEGTLRQPRAALAPSPKGGAAVAVIRRLTGVV